MCGDCMPQFHAYVCETKISFFNWWELELRVQNDMQARIQWFLEAFSLFLVFSVQTKPNNTITIDCIKSFRTKNHFKAEIRLPYSNWFDHLPFFCCLNSLFQVEVFEAIQHILTSRAGWKISKRVDVPNTVIEFNCKLE